MKPKFYSFGKNFTNKEGITRRIVIVGKLEKLIDDDPIGEEIVHNGKKGMFIVKDRVIWRKLSYAYAICHPDDLTEHVDDNIAINIAKRRIKENPLGELFSSRITTLTTQQIEFILQGELDYIGEHIDEILAKIEIRKTKKRNE